MYFRVLSSVTHHMRMFLTPGVRLLLLFCSCCVFATANAEPDKAAATPAESLTVVPGFKVELLHSAEKSEGSWICMTTDNKGRLIVSPQDDHQPLLRITLGRDGRVEKIEPIPAPVHQAMGLLYAHDSLYV